jgi:S-adenosylmethionine:diacylglycerol 3-amino-3-carboxypropyl transferase
LLGHAFGNYIVVVRGKDLIDVVDVSTSETVLQLKYPQKIEGIRSLVKTKDVMTFVGVIRDKDNESYFAINLLTANSRLLKSFDR